MLGTIIVFLVISLGFIAIMVILGWVKPWGWSIAGLGSGVCYYSYLEGWANYDRYIVEPVVEWGMGTRVPGLWEYVSLYSVVVFLFMIFAFTYNIYYSWYNKGLIKPFIEYAKPGKK